ncbi:MAG TPA: helix-turn-helix domain-containing protein [Candidatus Saccharimonadales bacterium]|nr:helix-turn-helix domain-containing protein [Candidatus Saccharimonadales bacterium]
MVREETTSGSVCQWREVIELIGDKWTVLILKALGHQQMRYSELHRQIPGISQKVLTASLRQLERDGFVKRTVYPIIPPKVEYEMTPLGFSVFDAVKALDHWATDHLSDIQTAREQYDKKLLVVQTA